VIRIGEAVRDGEYELAVDLCENVEHDLAALVVAEERAS
jgi:hypothetical protein